MDLFFLYTDAMPSSKKPSATYKKAGVDSEAGDSASSRAYRAAVSTHVGRKGMFGAPLRMEDSFTGALDCGDFLIVQNDDGVGSKMVVADAMGRYDTVGYDLLAMVADDAICVGAEVLSITNVIDVKSIDEKVIGTMMEGLAQACLEQNIAIVGGEIASLKDQVKSLVWNATAVGVVEKTKFITGSQVRAGDKIVGLQSRGFRSNGFTLVRYILEKAFGEHWHRKKFNDSNTWGEAVLMPSRIYHNCILDMIGRFRKGEPRVHPKAIVHNTGGGIPGNLSRILDKKRDTALPDRARGLGASEEQSDARAPNYYGARGAMIDHPFPAHQAMLGLQKLGNVDDSEAYRTWNMGIGMMLIVDDSETAEVIAIARKHSIPAQVIGEITTEPGIRIVSQGYFERGRTLEFEE
jgi:phosphoribosylformylglycinamidine cyclo-ligase